MDSELDRQFEPFERNEEFDRWLDEIYIRDEEGEKVHFSLTPAQRIVLEHHKTCAATRGLPCDRDCETSIKAHGRRKEF